jgi:hypothetical protein
LRSFKNKFENSLLDRHVSAELLEYRINGEQPGFSPERLRSSTVLLCHDLKRQSPGTSQSNSMFRLALEAQPGVAHPCGKNHRAAIHLSRFRAP